MNPEVTGGESLSPTHLFDWNSRGTDDSLEAKISSSPGRLLKNPMRGQLDFRYVFGADGFDHCNPLPRTETDNDDLTRKPYRPDFGGETVGPAQNEFQIRRGRVRFA